MFEKNTPKTAAAKRPAKGKTATPAVTAQPVPEVVKEVKAPEVKNASILSEGVVINGDVKTEGNLVVSGRVVGSVRAVELEIHAGAVIEGEVFAEKVDVHGTVIGTVRAGTVHLRSTGVIDGDLLHTSLVVEAGARFEGNVLRSEDPLSDGAPAPVEDSGIVVDEPETYVETYVSHPEA